MAKGKRPNNGNRPNNTGKPANGSLGSANAKNTSGIRSDRSAPVNSRDPKGNVQGKAQSSMKPGASNLPRTSNKPVERYPSPVKYQHRFKDKNLSQNKKVQKPRMTNTIVSGATSVYSNNNAASDQVPPQLKRPLFGDEPVTPAKVVEKEPVKDPRKLSWWKVRQLERKNRAQQKAQLKEQQLKEQQAIAEQIAQAEKKTKLSDVLEETRPEIGEARRQHMAKKRKRDALRAAFNALLSVMILVGMLIIAVLYVVDYVAAKPTYAFATEGSIEHTIGATALVVRNETVMTSTHTGSLLTQATEGSRVAKSQLLAMVIPTGMESTMTELHNVEQQIVDIERQLMAQGKGVAAKTIFSETNEEIKPIITMVRQDAILKKLNNMTSYSSSIRVLMEKRESDLKSIDFNDETLEALRRSEAALQNQLENNANSIYASSPGIVSYKLDGHESEITYDLVMDIVESDCAELIKKCSSIITSDLDIKQNEPVLRIVQNDEQYFCCLVKDAPMSEFQPDSNHVIRIPSEGISISDCKVVRCSVTRDGLLVVFQTTNQVERLLDRRTVNIEIVQTKTTGIRVPISTLANADYDRGVATIFVNESGYARGYSVQIKDYDREYAIIAPLENEQIPSISTIVITNPGTVKEGDKVEK